MNDNDHNQNELVDCSTSSQSASTISIAAMVCGICGIVFSIIVGLFGWIFGAKAMKESPKGTSSHTFGKVGVVCGWLSLLTTILIIIIVIVAIV